MDGDTTGHQGEVDGLLERAQIAMRDFVGAREQNDEGTARLLAAYEALHQDNAELADELARRDREHAVEAERVSRLKDESTRLATISRGTLQALDHAREEANGLREDLRASRAEATRIRETNDQLLQVNARLTQTVESLLSEMRQGARGISERSRRLSDMVPSPTRPRDPQPTAAPAPSPAHRGEDRPARAAPVDEADLRSAEGVMKGFDRIVRMPQRAQG